MSLRFDWYPSFQHEEVISRSDFVVDKLITKGMAQKTKDDLKRTTQQILSALYGAYTSLPKAPLQYQFRYDLVTTPEQHIPSEWLRRFMNA